MSNDQFQYKLDKQWTGGIPADIWLKYAGIIHSIIEKYKLVVADMHTLPSAGFNQVFQQQQQLAQTHQLLQQSILPAGAKTPFTLPIIPIHKIPYPGGIRVPHLHFNGDVYMLNDKQWGDFSGKVLTNLKEKLNSSNTISVEKLTEISNAVDSM